MQARKEYSKVPDVWQGKGGSWSEAARDARGLQGGVSPLPKT